MPNDWTATLEQRQQGTRSGFLANDVPLEDQDTELGGVNVPANEGVAAPASELEAMTKAELLNEAAVLGVEVPATATKAEVLELLKG